MILYGCHGGFEALYILETVKPTLIVSPPDEDVFNYNFEYIDVKPNFKELQNFKNFTFKSNGNMSQGLCNNYCRNLLNANYIHMNENGCGKYSAKFLNARKSKHSTEPQIMTWIMKLLLLIFIIIAPTILMFSDHFTKYFIWILGELQKLEIKFELNENSIDFFLKSPPIYGISNKIW